MCVCVCVCVCVCGMMQEAVSNVLDNALKYVLVRGDDPAPPRVSLRIQV